MKIYDLFKTTLAFSKKADIIDEATGLYVPAIQRLTPKKIITNETPIEDMNFIGNWDKNSSYREKDRKLLTNPKAQSKIIHKWEKTIVPFNIYFVNSPEANRFTEIGPVTETWLETNMPQTYSQIKINDDAVNIIYNNNKGSPKAPMTAWIMAHRFGHTMFPRGENDSWWRGDWRVVESFTHARNIILQTVSELLEEAYGITGIPDSEINFDNNGGRRGKEDKILTGFFKEIGTMRSARTRELANELEFTLELLSQYMITGKINFKPIPNRFRYSRMTTDSYKYGYSTVASYRPTYAVLKNPEKIEEYNGMLSNLANDLVETFRHALYESVGNIFVM